MAENEFRRQKIEGGICCATFSVYFLTGFVEPPPPGEDKVPSPDQKSVIHGQLQQTGDENGGPPGRYRPPPEWEREPKVRRDSVTRGR